MSIPRVVSLVTFGLISSVGPTEEPAVKAASPPVAQTQAAAAPASTVTVRIIVVPPQINTRDQAAIQRWLRTQGAIQPWDIIVVGNKPWLFIHEYLVPHDHADYHFELGTVHLSVSRHDQVRWQSDRAFCIAGIRKDEYKPTNPGAPDNPFPKLRTEPPKPTCSGKDFVVESGPPAPNSAGQRYKTTFKIGDETVDPDIVCDR